MRHVPYASASAPRLDMPPTRLKDPSFSRSDDSLCQFLILAADKMQPCASFPGATVGVASGRHQRRGSCACRPYPLVQSWLPRRRIKLGPGSSSDRTTESSSGPTIRGGGREHFE